MLAIPRVALGLTKEPMAFDLHWADNFQTNDISGLFLYGDSAPDRRFNYRFQSAASSTVTLREDSFDSGKQAWWAESWTNGSKWSLTSSGSYAGSSAICATANGSSQNMLVTRVDTSGLESLRVSFRYKLSSVMDAQNLNVQFYTSTGWVTLRDLGRDQFHASGQAWGYDERQNAWLLFTGARAKTGTNALFFHKYFAVRIDGSGVTTSSQNALVDDFLISGVLAPTNNLPAPWESADVGDVGISGDAAWTNGAFAVSGSGADIWSTSDGFRFVWQPRTGDGFLTARVTSQTPSDVWAKAGVMIRESLDAGARHAMMVLTPSNGLSFQRRGVTRGASAETTVAGSFVPPYWVRLTRSGTSFAGFASINGTNWAQIGATNLSGFGSNAFWGLAVTAHNNTRTSAATFDNVALSQPPRLALISNQSVIAGQTLVLTNSVTDPDQPPQALTWSLLNAPAGAAIDAGGVFAWRPTMAQSPATHSLAVRVADDGVPSLSATQGFSVTVSRPPLPTLAGAFATNGQFNLVISGTSGPDYSLYQSTNLSVWSLLFRTNSPALPFAFADSEAASFGQRFYRVQLEP